MNSLVVRDDSSYEKTLALMQTCNTYGPYRTMHDSIGAFTFINNPNCNLRKISDAQYKISEESVLNIDIGDYFFTMPVYKCNLRFTLNTRDSKHNYVDHDVNWLSPGAIHIGSLLKLFYYINIRNVDINKDYKLLLKKIIGMDCASPAGIFGYICNDKVTKWNWLPSTKAAESIPSLCNHLVTFDNWKFGGRHGITSNALSTAIESFASKNNMLKIFDWFINGVSPNIVIGPEHYIFDEPKSLVECIKMDIDTNCIFCDVVRMYYALQKSPSKKQQELLDTKYHQIIIKKATDIKEDYPPFAYRNLYFTEWSIGASYDFELSYHYSINSIIRNEKLKYLTNQFSNGIGKYSQSMYYIATQTHFGCKCWYCHETKYTIAQDKKKYKRQCITELKNYKNLRDCLLDYGMID